MGNAPGIRVYQTLEHACGYWPDRQARDRILDPDDPRLPQAYGDALSRGYRRSGGHVYRPQCANCAACTPVRIPADRFRPDRSQRRCLKRNADLTLTITPARRTPEHFALYRRYLVARHRDGGMDDATEASFDAFLSCPWSPTAFLEWRLDDRLMAVAVTDVTHEALSAVYTFFEPDAVERSLGTFAILQQVRLAQANQRAHLYLGFWLAGHPKMAYKRRFQPLEYLCDSAWQPLPPAATATSA